MSATLTDRLADHFRRHPGVWFDGRTLATIAGAYAWRTRISELRRLPYMLDIENRVQHITERPSGRRYRVSWYRYRPVTVGKTVAEQQARTC